MIADGSRWRASTKSLLADLLDGGADLVQTEARERLLSVRPLDEDRRSPVEPERLRLGGPVRQHGVPARAVPRLVPLVDVGDAGGLGDAGQECVGHIARILFAL